MRRLYALTIGLAACGGSGNSRPTVSILAYAGDVAVEAGATVLTHRADGTVLDLQLTDGDGTATLQIDSVGGLVTVIYQRADAIQLVTTAVEASSDLELHGPPATRAPIIAGVIAVTAPAITADQFAFDLGCTTVTSPTLPADVNVNAPCFGTDSSIDVLARATTGGQLVGYAAAHVPIVDEVGMLAIPAWLTELTAIPIAQNELGATIELDEIADTFAFPTPSGTADHANAWAGLVADHARVRAIVGTVAAGQRTTQYAVGVPVSLSFGTADFLPQTGAVLTLTPTMLDFEWVPLGIGDVTSLHASWLSGTTAITWDVVLPPEAAHVVFPTLDATLEIPAPTRATLTTELRAIDSPDAIDFASAKALGIYIQSATTATIVPPPDGGELRETYVGGFH